MEELIGLLLLGGVLHLSLVVALPLAALVWFFRTIRRSVQSAVLGGDAAVGAGGDLLTQFLRSLQEAQRAFDDLPASSEAERQQKQRMILQMQSGISSQYGRLGSNATSSDSPTIANLHSMAAQNGIDWTPPNY
jgi:hypothetical protein